MKKIYVLAALGILFVTSKPNAQTGDALKLPELRFSEETKETVVDRLWKNEYTQPKKRKTTTTYVGAGYSFVIFTAEEMNSTYPVFDTRKGDFLSEVNLYFGFAIAKAVTLELEPSILFTSNDRTLTFEFDPPIEFRGNSYPIVYANNLSMLAFPVAINARFFPLYKQANSFIRLFFIGGGVGAAWIREEYDLYYAYDQSGFYNDFQTSSTSQWQPVFRIMTGFTGTGGQFGFGGEVRYNIVPLSEEREPFVTRVAKNFNSVDLTLRFYFSL